jgi:hypothetical protein
MPAVLDHAVETQRPYFTDSATHYEHMHANEGAGDAYFHKSMSAIPHMVEAQSVLEVGTATGKGLRGLRDALPDAFLWGIEPVAALLGVARENEVQESGALV